MRAILTAQRAPAHAGADQEKPDLFGEDPLVDVLQTRIMYNAGFEKGVRVIAMLRGAEGGRARA